MYVRSRCIPAIDSRDSSGTSCDSSKQQARAAMDANNQSTYDRFTGLPVPGGLSERLWNDSQAEVQQCLHHPFVAALAAGTLPR